MRYMKSNENYSISSNRFETTYGSSYNKAYHPISKPSIFKPFDKDDKQKSTINSKPKMDMNPPMPSTDLFIDSSKMALTNKFDNSPQQQQPLPHPPPPQQLDYNHMITQIAKITDSLYLSSLHAITIDKLRQLGITLVVSLLANDASATLRLPTSIQSMQVNIEDTESANLRRHFDRVLERINVEERRKGGRALVHCMAGISRSSTIVLAYLMRYGNMRLREAYDHVRQRRPYIQPNLGFWRQLIEYERSIFGSTTVTMTPLMDGSRLMVPDVAPSALSAVLPRVPQTFFSLRPPF